MSRVPRKKASVVADEVVKWHRVTDVAMVEAVVLMQELLTVAEFRTAQRKV